MTGIAKKKIHVYYKGLCVRIEPLKARHDVTKLDLIVHLLSLQCIDIDLSI